MTDMKRLLAVFLLLSSAALAAGLDARVNQAAVGMFDSRLSSRVKVSDKRKKVIWTKGLPELSSKYAEVTYDPEARSQTYFVFLKGFSGTLKDLAPKTVQKGIFKNTPVLQISGGMLDGSLLMLQKDTVKIYSNIYVFRFEPELMKFFK